ncbi:hypothetical protein GCG21_15310 [Pseudactinotalea sp. HY160]|uniref:hypothetical protein n=1 Tax=Pseudactinotalea sp. HY160 TaxID=2654490 RepID=UPI00128DF2EE|nr:hypothetical protein [Pseudactinotalea sp. HY160]MPV51352.1 hypothetical protein [Pseudactinotalea sp. HY160]
MSVDRDVVVRRRAARAGFITADTARALRPSVGLRHVLTVDVDLDLVAGAIPMAQEYNRSHVRELAAALAAGGLWTAPPGEPERACAAPCTRRGGSRGEGRAVSRAPLRGGPRLTPC